MAKKQTTVQADNIQEEKQTESAQKYPSELLVKSEHVKTFGLHRDIIRAILNKPEYTIEEAKKAIQKYIDSFVG